MKQFILKIMCFAILVLTSVLFVFSLADGSTDAMYLKFTTPKQSSLILGSSRAAQGIQPKYLESILEHTDIYNYAFQIPSSPYGEIYLESIKNKVNKHAENGLFILEVNPWTLSTTVDSTTNKSFLIEKNGFLEHTKYVCMNPNLEYLFESFEKKYVDIIRNRNKKGNYQTYFVEDDGWLHVTVKSDKFSKTVSVKMKIEMYRNKLKTYKGFSSFRIYYLSKTIQFLKQYGEVYLVRVPVIQSLLEIENELEPEFDNVIKKIANENKAYYINMMPELKKYGYTDGNHLDVISGKQFSIDLANKIKTLQH